VEFYDRAGVLRYSATDMNEYYCCCNHSGTTCLAGGARWVLLEQLYAIYLTSRRWITRLLQSQRSS